MLSLIDYCGLPPTTEISIIFVAQRQISMQILFSSTAFDFLTFSLIFNVFFTRGRTVRRIGRRIGKPSARALGLLQWTWNISIVHRKNHASTKGLHWSYAAFPERVGSGCQRNGAWNAFTMPFFRTHAGGTGHQIWFFSDHRCFIRAVHLELVRNLITGESRTDQSFSDHQKTIPLCFDHRARSIWHMNRSMLQPNMSISWCA